MGGYRTSDFYRNAMLRPRKGRGKPWWRAGLRWMVRWMVFGLLGGGLIAGLGVVGLYVYYAPTLPHFNGLQDYQPKLGTRMYSVDNQLIGEFAKERRILVPPDKIPRLLYQAFIAAEDKRFYRHRGIDLIGVLQAFIEKIRSPDEKLRGASTITQQVAKSLLVTYEDYESATERSLTRKLREAFLAYRLEHTLGKDQILYMYLNQTFLGHKAYGVQAASEHYFRKNVWELNLAQMATLAGLPQRPSDYSPYTRPQAALARRRYVLRRMKEDGYITLAQYQEAFSKPVTVYPREELYLQRAPYYSEQVRRALIDRYGERALLEEGLEVYTAVNLEHQALAYQALDKGLRALDKRQGFRGPLLHLNTVAQRRAFLAQYRADLGWKPGAKMPLNPQQSYVAVVTGFAPKGLGAYVDVASQTGFLPLAGMRWARQPHPFQRVNTHYITDVRKALSIGDVITVVPITQEGLAQDVHGKAQAYGMPVSETKPLFALEQEPTVQAAMMAVDPQSGYMSVQIGGYDFDESSYNRAVQACREPGSLFKPVVYSAALDSLDYTASTLIDDKPLVYDDPDNDLRWKPNNNSKRFLGRLPLRTCLKDSINTPAIRVAEAVGIDGVIAHAKRLGITSHLKRELGTALGSSCTTLLELMNVYVTFNQYGVRRNLIMIRRVLDRHGRILEDNAVPEDPTLDFKSRMRRAYRQVISPPRRVLDPQTAFLMISLLKNVVSSGTARPASHTSQVLAAKTGTTNEWYDAWFMALTRFMVTGIWVGYDKKERPLGMSEVGARTTLPIGVDFIEHALMDYSVQPPRPVVHGDFPPPEGVVQVAIDPKTGLLARPTAPKEDTVLEYYRQGRAPTAYAPNKSELNPQEVDVYNADSHAPL